MCVVARAVELRRRALRLPRPLKPGPVAQYTARNVCIVPGGRAGLIRLMSVLDGCSIGDMPRWG